MAVPNAAWVTIESGDDLRVTTRAGEQLEFDVEAVDAGILRGAQVELSFADIAVIERAELVVSTPTVILIAALAALVYLALASYSLDLDFDW